MYVKNENEVITKTYLDRKTIERKLMKFNENHYKKVMSTEAYKDKIYPKLQEDETRNKILNGTLKENECDSKEAYEFLKLLKKWSFNQHHMQKNDITTEEWIRVVKRPKNEVLHQYFHLRLMQCANAHY